jgi:hypothetical protein
MRGILSVLLLFPVLVNGDPQPWMVKENPNELAVLTNSDEDCPIDGRELTELAETVLAESGIKMVKSYESPITQVSSNILLLISLTCLPERAPDWLPNPAEQDLQMTSPGENFVVLAVEFGGLTYFSRTDATWVRFGWQPASGFVGKGSGDTLDVLVKPRIEGAVRDFVKANSDLGDQRDEE